MAKVNRLEKGPIFVEQIYYEEQESLYWPMQCEHII